MQDARTPRWHMFYAIGMAVASLAAYWVALHAFADGFSKTPDTVGAMWAAIAAAFVFRDSRAEASTAGIARLRATAVSFALCQAYLGFLPPDALGMAVIIVVGTLIVTALRWRSDIVTTAITTIVVLVLAELDPSTAWYQPALRFTDTLVGIAIGLAVEWLADRSLLRHKDQ